MSTLWTGSLRWWGGGAKLAGLQISFMDSPYMCPTSSTVDFSLKAYTHIDTVWQSCTKSWPSYFRYQIWPCHSIRLTQKPICSRNLGLNRPADNLHQNNRLLHSYCSNRTKTSFNACFSACSIAVAVEPHLTLVVGLYMYRDMLHVGHCPLWSFMKLVGLGPFQLGVCVLQHL